MQSAAKPVPSSEATIVGPYTLLGEVARGGMGMVHFARRSNALGFDQVLALKWMHANLAEDPKFVGMFLDEIRLSSAIEHPNVVRTLDVGEHEGRPYMVMELLKGKPLSSILRKHAIPPHVVMAILAQVAHGLHAAHEATSPSGEPLQIVHRDVSPQNIHVGYDGRVRVIDFGIAAGMGRRTTTETGEVKGKMAYLAPEQIRAGDIDRRVDVWALGVVTWEALTRSRLFRYEDAARTMFGILSGPIPRLGPEHASERIADVVARCLERSPDKRIADARAVAEAFEQDLVGMGGVTSVVHEFMTTRYIEDRAEDEARLRLAVQGARAAAGPPPTTITPTPALLTDADAPEQTRVTRRRGIVGAGVAIAIGILGVASWAAMSGGASPPTAAPEPSAATPAVPIADALAAVPPPSTAAAPPTSVAPVAAVAAEAQAAPTIDLELSVGAGVTEVRVDGVVHDERPLRVSLASLTETHDVELIGGSGVRVHRSVSAADHGHTLELPTARRSGRTAPHASGASGGEATELMPAPF